MKNLVKSYPDNRTLVETYTIDNISNVAQLFKNIAPEFFTTIQKGLSPPSNTAVSFTIEGKNAEILTKTEPFTWDKLSPQFQEVWFVFYTDILQSRTPVNPTNWNAAYPTLYDFIVGFALNGNQQRLTF